MIGWTAGILPARKVLDVGFDLMGLEKREDEEGLDEWRRRVVVGGVAVADRMASIWNGVK